MRLDSINLLAVHWGRPARFLVILLAGGFILMEKEKMDNDSGELYTETLIADDILRDFPQARNQDFLVECCYLAHSGKGFVFASPPMSYDSTKGFFYIDDVQGDVRVVGFAFKRSPEGRLLLGAEGKPDVLNGIRFTLTYKPRRSKSLIVRRVEDPGVAWILSPIPSMEKELSFRCVRRDKSEDLEEIAKNFRQGDEGADGVRRETHVETMLPSMGGRPTSKRYAGKE